jgi:beta-lactamase class A
MALHQTQQRRRYRRTRPPRGKGIARVLLFLILLAGINAGAVWWLSRSPKAPQPSAPVAQATETASRSTASQTAPPRIAVPLTPAPSATAEVWTPTWSPAVGPAVDALVAQYAAQGINQVGIVIEDLRSGEIVARNADRTFDAGSLYKLFVLWQTQVAIRNNVLNDDSDLTLTAANDRSDEDGYSLGAYGDTVTVSTARRLMIEASNNTAAVLLAEYFGWGTIQQLARAHGFIATTLVDQQTTTATDIARFFDGIVNQTLDARLQPEDYALMLSLLENQEVDTKLSTGFPADATFAHKTGDVPGAHHDAGVLFLPDNRAICITVLTAGDYDASISLQHDLAVTLWHDLTT